MDLEGIWKQSKILHEVTKDDTSVGFEEIWNKLTSWLPDLSWLKRIFVAFIMIIVICIFACIMIQCCRWCNQLCFKLQYNKMI